MKCYEIKSLDEYINLVRGIGSNKKLWYRGQSAAKYRLIPGVLRNAVATSDWAGRDICPEKANFSAGRGETVHYPNFWMMLSEYRSEISSILDIQPKNDLS